MSEENDIKTGISLSALSLTVALIMKMKELHLLNSQDVEDIQDNALLGLESLSLPNVEGVAEARQLLEGILDAASDVGKPKKS